jgi:hypothetical protein
MLRRTAGPQAPEIAFATNAKMTASTTPDMMVPVSVSSGFISQVSRVMRFDFVSGQHGFLRTASRLSLTGQEDSSLLFSVLSGVETT